MTAAPNPYATALDGLQLDDPVAAFFDFCRERERIRMLREQGAPPPWTDDEVLQRGRFLNVFREHDRVSQALAAFVAPVIDDPRRLVQALFFGRWCNKGDTLARLDVALLDRPEELRHTLLTWPDPPWCNVAAYPVGPARHEGRLYNRLDTATLVLAELAPKLVAAIEDAGPDIVAATRAANDLLGLDNDFPVFMAIVDLAGYRPDLVDPASDVPTGIGAVAFLDRLQSHLGAADHHDTCRRMIALQPSYWPEAMRPLQPIDIEYLACECRKYFSYISGTKRFEGKNRFEPGVSPVLTFDIPLADDTPETTQVHVIAGGPCSGKTTLLEALATAGYRVEPETAERELQAGIAAGQTAYELRLEPIAWQTKLLRKDHALFAGLPDDEVVFTDTSFLETVVFARRAGIAMGPGVQRWLRTKRYRAVFFLEPVRAYEQTEVRRESEALARHLTEQELAMYERYGYEVIRVPAAPVEERLALVLGALQAQ